MGRHTDKLIRDKIPQSIRQSGKTCKTHIANDKEYWSRLLDKLDEEVQEFKDDESGEEMADILEVLYAIIKFKGFSKDKIEQLRQKKFEERGGFNEKIILDTLG